MISYDILRSRNVTAALYGLYRHKRRGNETGIVRDILVNTMAADDLVTEVTRSPATMVLNMQDRYIIISKGE